MSNPLKDLKTKSLSHIIGYVFFLIIGLIGMSFQMIKYVSGELILVSKDYKVNPELILAGIFMLLIARPRILIEFLALITKTLILGFEKLTKTKADNEL
ncbi:hypothetical protein [Tenacibaculum ovolyticum]|uniref:hypothetical protein n=1 Tax=Tenacibaculum ovolyticum TaxID=104270 RepID=UPI0007EDA9CA|nr:hypothetical protein [Tenacibaculum ovolyticum]